MRQTFALAVALVAGLGVSASCGGSGGSGFKNGTDGGGGNGGGGGSNGFMLGEGGGGSGGSGGGGDLTCAQAAASKSYIGCDYWPTVTANSVWSVFDYTVVVANTQSTTAMVTVTGPGGVDQMVTVLPDQLTKIYLPWVMDLKGGEGDACGSIVPLKASITAPGSAYHLVSSIPVTVYQFNALEYQGTGGPPGKDWSSCPGNTKCATTGMVTGCFSFTNDASLLLPSTAMTGNYRVTGEHGWGDAMEGSYFVVTATQDSTDVTVTLSATANVIPGVGIARTAAGGTLSFGLNAGDVVEIVGGLLDNSDLSGSLVQANKPIQVLSGMQCADEPLYIGDMTPAAACDHLESSVLPAETLGQDYVVTVPTSPHAAVIGAKVRFYGNVDGTTLTYSPSQPPGCPSTLDAGQVAECTGTASCPYKYFNGEAEVPETANCVTTSFEVKGNNAFAVTTLMLGGSIVDSAAATGMQLGDPSMSPMVATEQYRTRYIFLAPTDYTESYADVVAPPGTTLTLDGVAVSAPTTAIDSSYSVTRIPLAAGNDGAHVLTGTNAFGVQVIGYGNYTSYQYPAGLDLAQIAPPPPPPVK
jgi:hypothetical protein